MNLSRVLFGVIVSLSLASSIRADQPNVVLIMADDLGYECIGANGGESYATPVLDRMARQGVRLEHCYSQPLCTPSRVKLMTGISNKRNYARFGLLEKSQTTFAHLFRDAGYATCVVGKWQLGADAALPDHFGFDEHCLWHLERRVSRYASPGVEINGKSRDFPGGYGPDVVTDYALEFIDRHRDQPFLVYYPMILTHCPFEPTPDSAAWDPSSKGSKTYKGDPQYFGDMVTYMDKQIGKLLARLDQHGLREKTLVIFTGDNGTDQPIVSVMNGRRVAGGKGKMTDAGTRVPMIVDWKGTTAKGLVLQDIVDFSDILPTICDAAEIDVPSSLPIDGRSFLPQLRGEQGNPRDYIHIWYARHGGRNGKEFTRNQRYKLYSDGRFFDVENDVLEEHPLNVDTLDGDAKTAHAQLAEGLAEFEDTRPERFAQWNQKKK